MPIISPSNLTALVERTLIAAGSQRTEAQVVADHQFGPTLRATIHMVLACSRITCLAFKTGC